MAIAVNGGHVSRALDFYEKEGKYFIIGGTQPWENEPTPDSPLAGDFKLRDVIGLKRIDNTFFVIPDDDNGTIVYRNQKWRVISKEIVTNVNADGVSSGSAQITVNSVSGLKVGDKIRVANIYEGTITSMSGQTLTLDTVAPSDIAGGSEVLGGALIEGAKYVYVEGYLEYDRFPLTTYRQIGLCTKVIPKDEDKINILKSAAYSDDETDEFESLGILEILDNRTPIPRDISMRELISMIVEF